MSSSYFMQIHLDKNLKLWFPIRKFVFDVFFDSVVERTSTMMNTHLYISVSSAIFPLITFYMVLTFTCLPKCTEMGSFLTQKKQICWRFKDVIIRLNSKVKRKKPVRLTYELNSGIIYIKKKQKARNNLSIVQFFYLSHKSFLV